MSDKRYLRKLLGIQKEHSPLNVTGEDDFMDKLRQLDPRFQFLRVSTNLRHSDQSTQGPRMCCRLG